MNISGEEQSAAFAALSLDFDRTVITLHTVLQGSGIRQTRTGSEESSHKMASDLILRASKDPQVNTQLQFWRTIYIAT